MKNLQNIRGISASIVKMYDRSCSLEDCPLLLGELAIVKACL